MCAVARAETETIHDIVVEGARKTTPDTVEYIAQIDRGDEWQPEMASTIKERLVSSGLFKDVEVYWAAPDKTTGPGLVDVHIIVADRFSWVIAPAFYTQPTNTGGGIGYGENNLFGLNQKLLVYGQLATGDSFFFGIHQAPSVFGLPIHSQVDVYLADSRNFEYAAPTKYLDNPKQVRESRLIYLNGALKLGARLFRGFSIDTRVRAAKVRYSEAKLVDGATEADVDPEVGATTVPKPGIEGWDVSNEWDFTLDRRANWYGIATGYKLQLQLERSIDSLSAFHYYEAQLFGYRAYKVLEHHNFIIHGGVQIGHHLPFQQEFQMGGTSMRGWINNQFRGDFKVSGTVEYSFPLFTIYDLGVQWLGLLRLRLPHVPVVRPLHAGRQHERRAQLPAEQRRARAVTVQELDRRRDALLPAIDRVAPPGTRCRVWSRSR
jgi:outer membrane protein assembly factor BamA